MRKTATALSDAARDALRAAKITDDGLGLKLEKNLDRKLYEEVAEALLRAGFKWNRYAGCHKLAESSPQAAVATLREMLDTGIAPAKNPLAYYPTPPAVARRAVQSLASTYAFDKRGAVASVLEPSAGDGALLRALADEYPMKVRNWDVAAVEIDLTRLDMLVRNVGSRFGHLYAMGADFTELSLRRQFDFILMNPPFDNGQARRHIVRAFRLLVPGGAMVAIAPAGITPMLGDLDDYELNVEALPDGSFSAAGTEVRTVLLTLEKPA